MDDKALDRMQQELGSKMEKCDPNSLPRWLKCNRQMIPDLISKENPEKSMAVWEISGAEFTRAETHTADGISIRFPRITRIRDDKTPKEATNLDELKHLFEESKKHLNLDRLNDLRDPTPKEKNDKDKKPKTHENGDKKEQSKKIEDFFGKAGTSKRKPDDGSSSSIKKVKLDQEKIKKEDSDEKLFSGIFLFVRQSFKDKVKDELVKFEKLGGILMENSLKSNYAIHESNRAIGTVDEMRLGF